MAGKTTEIQELIEPVLQALGYELWGLEYIGQGRHSMLRVYLEKEGGVNVEDCAQASRQISSILDVEDPISGEYTLEVSSPGIDRMLFKLDQYKEFAGSRIKLRLRENFEGQRNFSGLLKNVVDDEVILVDGEDEIAFPFELIEKANIVMQDS